MSVSIVFQGVPNHTHVPGLTYPRGPAHYPLRVGTGLSEGSQMGNIAFVRGVVVWLLPIARE